MRVEAETVTPLLRHSGERGGSGAVDARRFVLADQAAVGREHRVELQRPEESVIADVETDEGAELDDLLLGIVPAQLAVEPGADLGRVERHQLAVAQRELFRLGKARARRVIGDALVDVAFREALPLRRSGPDVSSIDAGGHAGELHPDDLLQLVADAAGVEDRVPGDEHRLAQIDVVAHHRVEARIGRTVLEAFVDIGPELGLPQLLDIEHGDVRHGGRSTKDEGGRMKDEVIPGKSATSELGFRLCLNPSAYRIGGAENRQQLTDFIII